MNQRRNIIWIFIFLFNLPIFCFSQTNKISIEKEKSLNIQIKKDKKRNFKILAQYKDCQSKKMKLDKIYLPAEKFDYKKETASYSEYRVYPFTTKDGYYLFKISYGFEDHDLKELIIVKYFKSEDCYSPKSIKFEDVGNENEAGAIEYVSFSKNGKYLLFEEVDDVKDKCSIFSLDTLELIKNVNLDASQGPELKNIEIKKIIEGEQYIGVFEWLRSKGNYP